MKSEFGNCSKCGCLLESVKFTEEEMKIVDGTLFKTGRKRTAVSVLICSKCGERETVDDSFDGPWY